MSDVLNIGSKDSFDKLLSNGKPTLVDFYATWCGPCQMMGPLYDKFASSYKNSDKANIVKVDIDAGMDIAEKYGVMSVPTFVLIDKTGKVVDTMNGMRSADELEKKLDELV